MNGEKKSAKKWGVAEVRLYIGGNISISRIRIYIAEGAFRDFQIRISTLAFTMALCVCARVRHAARRVASLSLREEFLAIVGKNFLPFPSSHTALKRRGERRNALSAQEEREKKRVRRVQDVYIKVYRYITIKDVTTI